MNSPETTPCYAQTADEVEACPREDVHIGATVAIRHAQAASTRQPPSHASETAD